MTRTTTVVAAALVITLAASARPATAAEPEPTPTRTPGPKKKLGGGSFGTPRTTPTPGGAESSLADAARKAQVEEEAAGARSGRRIVITNETLRRSEPAQGSSAITITGTAGAKPSAKVRPSPDGPAVPEYRDASGKTESDWRRRAAAVRERAAGAEADLTKARAEVRRLENDFYAWSDGNYRERVIRPAWDQAREKARLLETTLDEARKAVNDLEEEARKSGTPPGWLR